MSLGAFLLKVHTARRLGTRNIFRVLAYRILCRLGAGPVAVTAVPLPAGDIFLASPLPAPPKVGHAPRRIRLMEYFGWKDVPLLDGGVPDWFLNPFTGEHFSHSDRPWYRIPDFNPEFGDIKCAWEPSRWGWLPALAQEAVYAENGTALERLNAMLLDWTLKNPAYKGPNWKCGQEAAIRVLNLAVTARLLGQVESASAALRTLIRVHLSRIEPTVLYAVAQDNNHGTSEAAALLVGGSWLSRVDSDPDADRWARQGRRWLEDRVDRLVMPDGSFSQYSSNYHRLMLDTLVFAELWRRNCGLPPFSSQYYGRLAAATEWLRAMVQPETGAVPNFGANDGAHVLRLTSSGYRDFRPSVQLASALFLQDRAYEPGPWDDQLAWLAVEPPARSPKAPASRSFDDGGYVVLRQSNVTAYLRFPRYRFRPSHADALHLDLWCAGKNWLRDGGTFSYAAPARELDYFPGTASHNTIQFDGRDQMPRLSRFLYGAWLEACDVAPVTSDPMQVSWSGAYRDHRGAYHRRTVVLASRSMRVSDEILGFQEKAVLRWRLCPGVWRLDGQQLNGNGIRLNVSTRGAAAVCRLVDGWESRFYHQSTTLPVLEAEVKAPCTLVSEFSWG